MPNNIAFARNYTSVIDEVYQHDTSARLQSATCVRELRNKSGNPFNTGACPSPYSATSPS